MNDTTNEFSERAMCLMKREYNRIYEACYDEKSNEFPQYGACGIRMSRRWKRSFACFYMDMKSMYTLRYRVHIIDRTKLVDAHNVKWVPFENREAMYLYVKHADGITRVDEYMRIYKLTFAEVNEQRKQKLVVFRKRKEQND